MNNDARARKLRGKVLESVQAVADPNRGDKVFADCMRWIGQLYTAYSCANTMLILSAVPDATYVAGYKRWQALGRQVRLGQRGVPILVPIHGAAIEEIDPLADEPIIHRPVRGFGVGHVWDISQTDGPATPNFKVDLGGNMRPIFDAAVALAAERGIEVEFRTLPGSVNGVSQVGKIVINSARTVGVQAQCILHELGHEAMHPKESRVRANRSLHEGEAEACAWATLQHFCFEGTMENAACYIRSHHAEPRDLLGSLERITATAHDVVRGLERHLPPEMRPHALLSP